MIGHRAAREAGFTLVEVLVALAILAIGFGYGYRALSDGFVWVDRARSDAFALSVASSLLARIGTDIPVRDGLLSGQADGILWRIETSPLDDAASRPQDVFSGHRVVVTVTWHAAGFDRQIRIVTVRTRPRIPGA